MTQSISPATTFLIIINLSIEEANDAQLQSMLENYKKHVIKQKQQKPRNRGGGGGADCERSASHLHRKYERDYIIYSKFHKKLALDFFQ